MRSLEKRLLVAIFLMLSISCSSSDSGLSTQGMDGESTPAASIINQQNYQALLHRLLPVIDGTNLDVFSDELVAFLGETVYVDDSLAVSRIDSSFDPSSRLATSNFTCQAGGTSIVREVAMLTQYEFSDCVIAGQTYNGSLSTDFRRDQYEKIFTALEVTGSTVDVEIEGTLQGFNSTSAFYRQSLNFSVMNATFPADGEVTISDQMVSVSATNNDGQTEVEREFSSSLVVSAPWIGINGESLEVETLQAFAGTQPDGFYTSGVMTIIASDGSFLRINADNGDPATVQATVEFDETTTSETLNWDNMLRLVCLDDTNFLGEPQFTCGD